MIHLEQGQSLKEEPKVRVAVATGDYNETDLIECVRDGEDLSEPTCMYQAQYIAFGNPVYQQSEELTEDQVSALLANTPAHEVINNRKLIDNKKPAAKFSGQIIQRKGPVGKKELRRDLIEDKIPVNKKIASTTDPVANQPVQQTTTTDQISTSTPISNSNNNASSTPNQTANVLDSINQNATSTSTTTPSVSDLSTTTPAMDINTGTTTPDVISNIGTSTPIIGQDFGTSTPNMLDINATTTTDTTFNNTTTTPEVNNNLSTTTPGVTPVAGPNPVAEPIPDQVPQIPENNVAEEIVAFAKRKIIKKLRI